MKALAAFLAGVLLATAGVWWLMHREVDVERLLVHASEAKQARKWVEAEQLSDQVLQLQPNLEIARDLKSRAVAEEKNRALYQRAVDQLAAGEMARACEAWVQVGADSVYRTMRPERLQCPGDEATDEPHPPKSGEPEAVWVKAQDAYVHGRYSEAIALAEQVKDKARGNRIIGASSCLLKKPERARAAYDELDAPGRMFLKYVCERNGVTLP
jgi:hypothetical protein